jgi:hypothetical protein
LSTACCQGSRTLHAVISNGDFEMMAVLKTMALQRFWPLGDVTRCGAQLLPAFPFQSARSGGSFAFVALDVGAGVMPAG